MTEAADVLDRMANPHPRLMAGAARAYRRRWCPGFRRYWVGYRDAMVNATGESRAEIVRRVRACCS